MAKTLVGIVASDKPDKSIVVRTQTSKTHPIYRKKYMVSARFMAHDKKNEAKEGDKVIITETRPLSARKRFVLTKILERAQVRHIEAEPETVQRTVSSASSEASKSNAKSSEESVSGKPKAEAKKAETPESEEK